ncbi:MAG TPA: sugar phosphate isomerase/epimerase [Terriglobia bacterium]|nr:sugar phosphate isomerase/epimerase [Terriglobia bacterium]
MAPISRREAGKILIAGAAGVLLANHSSFAVPKVNSVVRGVTIGAQSYSFRDRPLDAAIQGYLTAGLSECELYQGHVEPAHLGRAALRKWRLAAAMSHFHEVRRKFDAVGIELYAYNYSFRKDFTHEEMDRGFQMARALGVKYITASSNVSLAHQVDLLAQKYKIMVGFHGHDDTRDPDEFSTADSFERALKGASPYLGINLDIGHFTAANQDAVGFLRKYHQKMVTLHIKDRKRNHGDNLPFGEGDTPITAVLHLLRDNHWKIPANIEYEYGKKGMDTIAEMKKSYAYCRKALES